MKVFAYLRVSSVSQVNGNGLDRQEQAIKSYCAANDLEILQIYREEGVSGTREERPALAEMLLSLKQNGHGVNTIVIEKVDRLARDLLVQERLILEFKKNGFNLVSVHEGKDLLDDNPTRILVRQMLGSIAQYEKTQIVDKLKAARTRVKLKTGKCEGRKSYLEAMPELVKEIKRLRRRQVKSKKRMTYQEIADILNERGLKSMDGKPFTHLIVQQVCEKY